MPTSSAATLGCSADGYGRSLTCRPTDDSGSWSVPGRRLSLRLCTRRNFRKSRRTYALSAGADQNLANRRQQSAPGERETVGEMGLNPVRHELRREFERHGARTCVKLAQGDRAEPAVERPRTAVPAKAESDLLPGSRDRAFRMLIGRHRYINGRRNVQRTYPFVLTRRPSERLLQSKSRPPRKTPPTSPTWKFILLSLPR